MALPEIPADVAAKVKRLFRSDKRKAIAMELLYYDYWPSGEDKQKMADSYDLHITSIDKTLYKLRDSDLFTKEQGSIPLYRARLREETKMQPSLEGKDLPETVVVVDDVSRVIDSEEEGEDMDLQDNRLKKMEVELHDQRERFENFMVEIRASLNKLSADIPENNPGPAEDPVTPPSNPVVEEPNNLNPFDGMSGSQVYEMLLNQPREFMDLMGIQNRPPQGDIQAVPVTVRKVIVDVTTYTLTCYEKAVNDGAFDGTFSDFMNQCVYKYFEDRGLALGWHKVDPLRRYPG